MGIIGGENWMANLFQWDHTITFQYEFPEAIYMPSYVLYEVAHGITILHGVTVRDS